jgi:hypothetical protein
MDVRVDEARDDQLAAVIVQLRAGGQVFAQCRVVASLHDLAARDYEQAVFPVLVGIALAILRIVQEMQHAAAVSVNVVGSRGHRGHRRFVDI